MNENKSSLKLNLSFIKEIFKADPFRIPYDIITKTLQSIMGYIVFLFAVRMVLNSIDSGLEYKYVFVWLLIFGVSEIIYILIRSHYYEIYAQMSQKKIYAYFRKKIYAKSKELDYSCFENADFYDKYTRVLTNIEEKITEEIDVISALISNIITICTVVSILLTFDPIFILLSVIPFVVKLMIGKKESQERYNLFSNTSNVQRKVEYIKRIFFLKDYAKEIRLSSITKILFEKFKNHIALLNTHIQKSGKKIAIFVFISGIAVDVLCYISAVILTGYRYLISKTMLLGDAFLVIDSIRRISGNISELATVNQQFKVLALFIRDVESFFSYKSQLYEEKEPKTIPSQIGKLELKHVYFRYPFSEKDVLHDINIEVKPYQKIAIVGPNGCGKSTIVKLLMRLYDVNEGAIVYDNNNIKQYNISDYRNQFATVFQDCHLVSATISENILLGRKDVDSNLVDEALEKSGLYEKVLTYPNGKDSMLTKEFDNDGLVLSGGQVQKIALSRVYANPKRKIVILDEPSSALDPIAEADMYKTMLDVCKNNSVIFISHRMSSATLADVIFYMEEGRIVESGSHNELMLLGGKYRQMFDIQSKNYKI